jgi:hypothetical protein
MKRETDVVFVIVKEIQNQTVIVFGAAVEMRVMNR